MITKKYWMFIINDEYNKYEYIPVHVESGLYAYTDNELYAKTFMSERDMSKFTMIKRHLDRVSLNELIKDYQRSALISYDCITVLDTGNYDKVSIIMTMHEKSNIVMESNRLTYNAIGCAWVDPYIFKSKYVDALAMIKYISAYSYTQGILPDSVDLSKLINVDILEYFLKTYSNILVK